MLKAPTLVQDFAVNVHDELHRLALTLRIIALTHHRDGFNLPIYAAMRFDLDVSDALHAKMLLKQVVAVPCWER